MIKKYPESLPMNNLLISANDIGGIVGPSFVRKGSSNNDNFESMTNNKISSGGQSFVSDKQYAM